jgi:hypothetical protein
MPGELEYYKEQLDHGRHIEVQRSTIAGLVLTASGAIIGKLLSTPLKPNDLPYTIALLSLNLVALLISAKLYERFRLHNEIARLVRDSINPNLASFRRRAEITIQQRYPTLFHIRLHVIWNCLFGVLAVLGLVTTVLAACARNAGTAASLGSAGLP